MTLISFKIKIQNISLAAPDVYIFKYSRATDTYEAYTPTKTLIKNQFGTNMADKGDCFLATNESFGHQFVGTKIRVTNDPVTEWDQADPTAANPYYMINLSKAVSACTQTHDTHMDLFFDTSDIWCYDHKRRQVTSINFVCTTSDQA